MDLRLRGSAVLLVGGTRGIGREVARLLGEEGARLGLVARDPDALDATAREVRRLGGQAVTIAADVTDPDQAARAVAQAAGALGTFDALIYAAGRGFRGAFLEIPEATWREAFDLNFFAPVRMIRLAAPHLHRGGRVVLLGAASAKQPQERQAPSNAAKAALANLTTALAQELAPDLVVNCVAPGRILTERRRERAAAEGRAAGATVEEGLRQEAAEVPLGRLGDPREVAGLVVFLASPWASYITGRSIIVDGGLVRSV
ncbi:MAG: SDR family oxidoreductase [Armatimonadota bacterium]|nr:SDR family oxidoreductase [Armatimonadota bacterium]MDR7519112.1 SDR family oxidoreductase [Armatimonadota bacterium]MDR7548959.1 SDR family oxidoreductase [Armatimonadota bacterium]